MKGKVWLLASLFFGRQAGSAEGAELRGKSSPGREYAFIENKLSHFNISMDPLVKLSPNLAKDKNYTKKEKDKQVTAANKNVIKNLQNPEVLCALVAAQLLALGDQSGSLVPLDFLLEELEALRGKHNFFQGKTNTIYLEPLFHNRTIIDQAFVFRHELCHALSVAYNRAVCHLPQDEQRKKARFVDPLLNDYEEHAAPYNSTTKADFTKALLEGEARVDQLRNQTASISEALKTKTYRDRAFRKWVQCFEEEAGKHQVEKRFDKADAPVFVNVLAKLKYEIQLIKRTYPLEKQIYEIYASIFAVLVNFPKLFLYLFPELRAWHAKVIRIPEYQACLDVTAPPDRLTLSCGVYP